MLPIRMQRNVQPRLEVFGSKMINQRFFKLTLGFADKLFVLAGTGCFVTFAYFFYNYSWTKQRQFSGVGSVAVDYVLPILLAAVCFAGMRLKPTVKSYLAVSLLTAGVLIVSLETALALWSKLPSVEAARSQAAVFEKRIQMANALGMSFDKRTRMEVVKDLRHEGMDAVPAVYPAQLLSRQSDGTEKASTSINGLEILPLAGVADKLAVACNESGQYISYRSDEHGFNNPLHLWEKSGFDIVALGDSHVQIWCVPPEKNLVALIRNRYPATLNLAMEGDGPVTELATLKEYARVAKPKLVLWFFYEGNDLNDLKWEPKTPILMRYLNGEFSQNLFMRQPEIDQTLNTFIDSPPPAESQLRTRTREMSELVTDTTELSQMLHDILTLSQLRQALGLVGARNHFAAQASGDSRGQAHRGAPDPSVVNRILLLQRTLAEAHKTVSEWGGELYVVYLPGLNRYLPGEVPDPNREPILETIHRLGLPLIDIDESFRAQKEPWKLFPFGIQGHYTVEGNRLIAEQVLRSITVNH
jgi:hypothetical protein